MAQTTVLPPPRETDAVVFDVDGAVTGPARVHAAAWKEAFDACLRAHPPAGPARRRPFDAGTDHLRHVDGGPRLDGAAASSRHATELLRRAGAAGLVAAVAGSRRLGLPGEPDPALFPHAAERLHRPPGRTAVVEDALARHEAGRRDGFAAVTGADRLGDGAHGPARRAHGADTVVRGLAELLTRAAETASPGPTHTADHPREEAS
ncbi:MULTISPECIES: HAD family hydrolase [Streptomyces]|uniref:Hydrolase n=1 Tax=Streptomyces griseus TaxID=1911 RepID=A0A380P6T7_STRGR|nr:hydrolase [Streptomyces griseus]WSU34500.1 hydrolase [Streptomyces gougerotii]SUP60618.1 hydrolase [Streptomyces griseus]